MRKKLLLVLVALVFFLTVYGAYVASPVSAAPLMKGVLSAYTQTGALNAVTAVYLDFRIFDTLLETFLLLVSVMGLSQFLRLENTEQIHMEAELSDNYKPSPIARMALHFVLPLLVIFGLTITGFGPDSPGGGFQGGSVLATIVMASYLTNRRMYGSLEFFTSFEEWLYSAFLLLAGGYFLFYAQAALPVRTAYMILSNFIICFKVDMGLIVVFLRLVGQSQHRISGDSYE